MEFHLKILGTPLPEIRWRKQGGALPWGRTTYDNYGKTLVIKHVDFEDAGQVDRFLNCKIVDYNFK